MEDLPTWNKESFNKMVSELVNVGRLYAEEEFDRIKNKHSSALLSSE